jgi:hypothetical protein
MDNEIRGEELLKPLNEVDYNAEIWGQYFGGIARAVVEQYSGQLYVIGKDQQDTSKEHLLIAIRTGFLKAFGGMDVDIMTHEYDTSISEEQLSSLDDDDYAWFKEKIGLTRDDLFRVVAEAKKILQELKPTDELLGLTYDGDNGAWHIHFKRDGHWQIDLLRPRQVEQAKTA